MSERRRRRLFRGDPRAEVDDELAFHIEQRVRDYVARGMDEASARDAALKRFGGNVEQVRDECTDLLQEDRRVRSRRDWMGDLRQDVAFGVRAALRAPLFTLLAVVTLALGIGANAAVFGVVKSVLLDSLPYADADRLVRIYSRFDASELDRSSVSPGAYTDMSRLRSFSALTGFSFGASEVTIVDDGGPRVMKGAVVAGNFFETLGVQPALGRVLTTTDEPLQTVMLSHGTWQRDYGAEPGVIGRTLRLAGASFEVVGVLPPDFTGPMGSADMWFVLDLTPVLASGRSARDQHWMGVIGRLAPGATMASAAVELDQLAASLEREHPDTDNGRQFNAVTLRESMVGETRTPLLVLMASAAFVLLATCANLAGALLSRTLARRKEFAVRVALGAGRGRLVRQLLTETTILSLAGAAAGLLLAVIGLQLLRRLALPVLPSHATLALDAGAVFVTTAAALLAGLVFGLAPALTLGSAAPQGTLREESRSTTESRRSRTLRGALVAAQIALSLSLLAGAGLLVRSLITMSSQEVGFEPDGVFSAGVQLSTATYGTAEERARFFDELTDRLRALPGVSGAASATQLPSSSMSSNGLTIENVTLDSDGPVFIPYMSVSDDWFSTMKIDVLSGRTFGPQDRPGATPAIVISRAFADRYWRGRDPLGTRIRISPHTAEAWGVVIGVVNDVRSDPSLPVPEPLAYATTRQDFTRTGRTFVVRTQGDAQALMRPFQRELSALDAETPLRAPQTLRAWLDERLAPRRLPVLLMTAFGALTLVLSSVGVYALFASMAAARAGEFGLRMALGSTRGGIAALMLRQGALWMAIGLAGGAAGVVVVVSLMRSLLYGVAPWDPIALGAAVLALLISATLALLIPVRRATAVDPAETLR